MQFSSCILSEKNILTLKTVVVAKTAKVLFFNHVCSNSLRMRVQTRPYLQVEQFGLLMFAHVLG